MESHHVEKQRIRPRKIRIPEPEKMDFYAEFNGSYFSVQAVVTDRTPELKLVKDLVFVGTWGETSDSARLFIVPNKVFQDEEEKKLNKDRAERLAEAMTQRGYKHIQVVSKLPKIKKES